MSTKAVAPTTPAKSPMAGTTSAPVAAPAASTVKKPTRVATVDPNETPEHAFKRLVEPRVTKVLKACKQIRNLTRFKPTDAQREKVFKAIQEAVDAAHDSWKGGTAAPEGFSL